MVLVLNSAVSVNCKILLSKFPKLFAKAAWLAIKLSSLSFMLVSTVRTEVAKSSSCLHGSVDESDVDCAFLLPANTWLAIYIV